MEIYLKTKNNPSVLKDLLLELFSNGGATKRTNVTTYSNKDCTTVQCSSGRLRSFDDVLKIAKTYFPRTTAKKLIKELLTLDFGLSEPLYLKMSNCTTIRRIVMWYDTDHFEANSIFDISKYDSEYSWKELLEALDISDKKSLKAYVAKYIKVKPDITTGIESYEGMCAAFGEKELTIADFSFLPEGSRRKALATERIRQAERLFNGTWKTKWGDSNHWNHYPVFTYTNGGWSFHYSHGSYVSSSGQVAYFKSKKISDFVGRLLLEEYKHTF